MYFTLKKINFIWCPFSEKIGAKRTTAKYISSHIRPYPHFHTLKNSFAYFVFAKMAFDDWNPDLDFFSRFGATNINSVILIKLKKVNKKKPDTEIKSFCSNPSNKDVM